MGVSVAVGLAAGLGVPVGVLVGAAVPVGARAEVAVVVGSGFGMAGRARQLLVSKRPPRRRTRQCRWFLLMARLDP